MITIYKCFDDENTKREFVYECEDRFEAELDRIAREISETPGLKVVTLSGPTCSGKTTTAATLIRDLNRAGRRVKLISIDDFFRDRAELISEAEAQGHNSPDFETVRAIDFDYFSECVDNIAASRPVACPSFDFALGKRCGYESFDSADYDVVLFEGIQAIYPEITNLFHNYRHKSVFISVADDLKLNGIHFDKREIRFYRRLVRDFTYRASSPEHTYGMWDSVAHNEEINILPYSGNADVIISSLLGYELFVIKPFATTLLSAIPEQSQYFVDARAKIEKLNNLETINSEYVPADSVFREFIGPKRH